METRRVGDRGREGRETADELNAPEEIERSRFLGTRRTNTDPTKRFRSFDIPKPPRSYSFCRPSTSAPSTALKRHVFAHRDIVKYRLRTCRCRLMTQERKRSTRFYEFNACLGPGKIVERSCRIANDSA